MVFLSRMDPVFSRIHEIFGNPGGDVFDYTIELRCSSPLTLQDFETLAGAVIRCRTGRDLIVDVRPPVGRARPGTIALEISTFKGITPRACHYYGRLAFPQFEARCGGSIVEPPPLTLPHLGTIRLTTSLRPSPDVVVARGDIVNRRTIGFMSAGAVTQRARDFVDRWFPGFALYVLS